MYLGAPPPCPPALLPSTGCASAAPAGQPVTAIVGRATVPGRWGDNWTGETRLIDTR